MAKPKKIWKREDKTDGIIYICPYCHRYVSVPLHPGLQQCFVCGGFVDTSEEEYCPDGIRVKSDGLRPWR